MSALCYQQILNLYISFLCAQGLGLQLDNMKVFTPKELIEVNIVVVFMLVSTALLSLVSPLSPTRRVSLITETCTLDWFRKYFSFHDKLLMYKIHIML